MPELFYPLSLCLSLLPPTGQALAKQINRARNALIDSVYSRKSGFSQTGEDILASGILKKLSSGFYIDIGANHPTKLSNTYLFYKRGWRGIAVEPNREYEFLYWIFRSRDTFLPIGISPVAGFFKYFRQQAAVLSGFCEQSAPNAASEDYLPVLPLDSLLAMVPESGVDLLTVDVEGMNLEVLQSGPRLLLKTRLVIVEAGEQEAKIAELLEAQCFKPQPRTPHNLIYYRS